MKFTAESCLSPQEHAFVIHVSSPTDRAGLRNFGAPARLSVRLPASSQINVFYYVFFLLEVDDGAPCSWGYRGALKPALLQHS